jgi:hypoxanthine-guanine phosphoribosyltransferase
MLLDYVGFEIDQGLIVGYGIDCAEPYRCLRIEGSQKPRQ